jgi:hypothetical protein
MYPNNPSSITDQRVNINKESTHIEFLMIGQEKQDLTQVLIKEYKKGYSIKKL